MTNDKKVLLIYPGRESEDGNVELPLNLLYLGAYLEQRNIPFILLDSRLEDYHKINEDEILCIGISTMTGEMINSALNIAEYFKYIAPHIPIIWGGVHPSMLPAQTLNNKNVDYVIIGEGEQTLYELVECIIKETVPLNVNGLAFKYNNKIIINKPREFIDLNTLPITLPYKHLPMEKYNLSNFPVQTSRGCPYGCRFCYNLIFNRRSYRKKTAERVLDEIKYVVNNFNPKTITFTQDDEFFIDLERIKKICEGIIKEGYIFRWESFCRLDTFLKMDDATLSLVEKSGCSLISFGGESGNQDILNLINKGTKIEQILQVTERMSKTKIQMVISFMMGFPGETKEQFNDTCNMIDKIITLNPNCHPNGLFLYTPYPGTSLMDLITEKYNYQLPLSLEEWSKFKIYRNENMPWLSKQQIKTYKNISILSRFPFYKGNYKVPSHFSNNKMKVIIYHIYTLISKLRWRFRFFRMPLELTLLEAVLNKKRGYV